MISKKYIVPSLAFFCFIVLLIIGPIPQDQNYHHFADKRKMFGIPNFLNVITNIPFFFFGVAGINAASHLEDKKLKQIFFTLFSGFLLLTFGSGYYHLSPNNLTLVYDRMPIVIILMSFLSFIIYGSFGNTKGYVAFFVLNIIGLISVVYWIVSEGAGSGDLRWYGMVQFFPVIAIPLILLLYHPPGNFGKEISLIFVFFTLGKLCEMFDKQIYFLSKDIISGHSFKHLFMVAAELQMVTLVQRIKLVAFD